MPPKRGRKGKAGPSGRADGEDWAGMKVAELRKNCEEKGLDTKGTKAVLVQRLQAGNECGNDDDEPSPPKVKKEESISTKVKKVLEKEGKKRRPRSDAYARFMHCKNLLLESEAWCAPVYKDYDCMLNQTNIGHNNNKFYVIQVIHRREKFWTWTRWGRVGEDGQNSLKEAKDAAAAVKEFERKFIEKTKNDWSKRDDFKPYPGKYAYIELGDDTDEYDSEEDTVDEVTLGSEAKILDDPKRTCKLDLATQRLIDLIFDPDVLLDEMKLMQLDVKKIPLGKLSKQQIAKGFDTLVAIENELKATRPKRATLEQLSSQFFTQIPHTFGRRQPPVIDSLDATTKKKKMLLILSDIELAQSMQKEKEIEVVQLHPLDAMYNILECKLELMDRVKDKEEYEMIEKYIEATSRYNQLIYIWCMERESERERFKFHEDIKFRKLLWHGTRVAVVAAILKSGLRIMPHSGGKIGRGIYFASEHEMSYTFASTITSMANYRNWKLDEDEDERPVGIMFLAEVALGKVKEITCNDLTRTAAPPDFDSVVGRGRVEPDPTKDAKLTLDGHTIYIPQGNPIEQPQFNSSSFKQSEYVVYKESQVRLRYLLAFDMTMAI